MLVERGGAEPAAVVVFRVVVLTLTGLLLIRPGCDLCMDLWYLAGWCCSKPIFCLQPCKQVLKVNRSISHTLSDEDHYKVKNILVVFARIFSNLCIVFILNLSSESLM